MGDDSTGMCDLSPIAGSAGAPVDDSSEGGTRARASVDIWTGVVSCETVSHTWQDTCKESLIVDSLDTFMADQLRRIRGRFGKTEVRIRSKREALKEMAVETRRAEGAHTCCSSQRPWNISTELRRLERAV